MIRIAQIHTEADGVSFVLTDCETVEESQRTDWVAADDVTVVAIHSVRTMAGSPIKEEYERLYQTLRDLDSVFDKALFEDLMVAIFETGYRVGQAQ